MSTTDNVRGTHLYIVDPEQVAAEILERRGPTFLLEVTEAAVDLLHGLHGSEVNK